MPLRCGAVQCHISNGLFPPYDLITTTMNHRSNRIQRAYAILAEDILNDVEYAKEVAREAGININHFVSRDVERIEQLKADISKCYQSLPSMIEIMPNVEIITGVLLSSSNLFNLSTTSCLRTDEIGTERDALSSEEDYQFQEGLKTN